MSNQRYTPEFKDEAARQIVDRGYSVAANSGDVIARAVTCERTGSRQPHDCSFGKSLQIVHAQRRIGCHHDHDRAVFLPIRICGELKVATVGILTKLLLIR